MKHFIKFAFALILLTGQIDSSFAQLSKPVINNKLSRTRIKQVVDSLTNAMINYYVYPEKAIKVREQLIDNYKKGMYNKTTGPEELANKLVHDIGDLVIDRHIGMKFNPDAQNSEPMLTLTDAEKQEDSLRGVKIAQQSNFEFNELKILPGNIGYLKFNGFTHDIQAAKPTIAAALTFLSHTNALIIDLRQNGGGNVNMVSQLESYFFKQKTHMNDIIDRSSKDTILMYADPAKTDGLTLEMPLYILSSKRTFSGAEDFSYGMQGSKRAIIVGDTTGGGAHPVNLFSLGNGFTALIPFARSLSPYTHTDWEGTGVYPDVTVPATEALEKALQLIYTKQLAAATNIHEQNAIKWQIDKLHARYHKMNIDSKLLEQYTGEYDDGYIQLFIKDGRLFCKGKSRNNYVSELMPITSSVFTWWDDTDYEIEFIKNKNGNCVAFKILSPDGELRRMSKKIKIL